MRCVYQRLAGRICASLVGGVTLLCAAWGQAAYRLVKIPTSGSVANAIAMSHNGIVLAQDSNGFFIWSQAKGRQNVTGVPNSSSAVHPAAATAVNNQGEVVGAYYSAQYYSYRPFIWYPNGTFRDLGAMGGNYAEATGISDNGEVVGFAENASYFSHAFTWSMSYPWSGQMKTVGNPSDQYSEGYGIDNAGDVVGESVPANGSTSGGCIWAHGNNSTPRFYEPLVTMDGINSYGHFIGYDYANGYFWSPKTGMVTIQTHEFFNNVEPNALNDSDEVVGSSYDGGAFLWTPQAGLRFLSSLLPQASGVQFLNANGIDDNGDILAPGGPMGFGSIYLLVPTVSVGSPQP